MTSSYHLEDRNKNVPKLRFKGCNDEWKKYQLEEKGVFLKGNPVSKNDISAVGRPCILYGELYTKYSEVATKIFSKTNIQNAKLIVSQANDVLIPSSGETAIDISTATCVLESNIILGSDLNIFRPLQCDGCFISYSINHKNKTKIAKLAQGATIFHLYPNFLKKFKIYLPSKSEQEKIASFLTLIDKKIEKQKELVELLKKYKRGLLSAIFSQKLRFKDDSGNDYPEWEEKSIEEVCSITTGKGNTQDKEENGIYPFYVRSPIIEKSNKYIFDGEAVLTVGDGVGTGKVFHYANGKFNFHQRVYKMSDFSGIKGKYFYYYFSTHFYDRVKRLTAKTSVDSVRMDMIAKMKILIPCNIEQDKIVNLLTNIENIFLKNEEYLLLLQEYKKGLLQKMFI